MSLVFLRGQVEFMRSRGLDVHVMTSPGQYLERFAQEEGAQAHAIPMERRITPLKDLVSLFRIVGALRRVKPDVVHASTPKGGLLGTIAARMAGVPVVIYHIRGLAFTGGGTVQRTLLKTTERIAAKLAHRVLCVSKSVRDEAVAEGIVAWEKTVVLGAGSSNGVAAQTRFNPALVAPGTREAIRKQFGIPQDAVVVGFVGRLVKDKGVVELADAWESVSRKHPNAWLLIIGPWEPRDPVPQATREKLESGSQIAFAGEQEEMAPFYSAMDLVALPTYREGFPNVPLEAAAMQLPSVVTQVTGCVDAVVHGVTGTIVPPRDVASLADAISAYVENGELRRRHGNSGRERVLREFEPKAVWNALHDEYRALMKARA